MPGSAETESAPTLLDLLGTWDLSRVVQDHLTGERREVHGTATLTLAAPDRVRWHEEGTMTWAAHAVPVQRTLDVVRSGDGWLVLFADGRVFHPWAVGQQVEHPCAPDHYVGLVEVLDDAWTVRWRATGPEKDYAMTTVHSGRRSTRHGADPAD